MPTSFQSISKQQPVNLWNLTQWINEGVNNAEKEFYKAEIGIGFGAVTALTSNANKAASFGCGFEYATGIKTTKGIDTNTTYCACDLKANPLVQRFANSKEKVMDAVLKKLGPKCTTKIKGQNQNLLTLVNKYKDNIEKSVMEAKFNSTPWTSIKYFVPGVEKIKDDLVEGIHDARKALGACHLYKDTDTLNNACYKLQNMFPSQVCDKEASCCINLLNKACK